VFMAAAEGALEGAKGKEGTAWPLKPFFVVRRGTKPGYSGRVASLPQLDAPPAGEFLAESGRELEF
jgi:hypothetical protein